LFEWHSQAQQALADAEVLADVTEAENWIRKTAATLRSERIAPFAKESQRIWQRLRQQSNIDLGTVRLNHQPVASGTVWAASYSSFSDALRDPSIVEIGDRTLTIGPDACARACSDCEFDRATLAFAIAGDRITVTGTCGDGERLVDIQ